MNRAMRFDFLDGLPRTFFYIAPMAWSLTFVGMPHTLAREFLLDA
jgi:hypothetical protein